MRLKNPTDKDLTLNYRGTDYNLGAGVSEDFATDVATQWLYIYGFLKIVKSTDKEKDEVVEGLAKTETEKKAKKKVEDSNEE